MTDLFVKACKAYERKCKGPVYDRNGNVYPVAICCQPSRFDSLIGRKYVHLRNCNGDLARYVIKTGKVLFDW